MSATKVSLGSGFGGVGTGQLALTGQLTLSSSDAAESLAYQLENLNSPCYMQEVNLANGANTITVPTKSAGVVIIPPSDADFQATLKGVSGDTGIALAKRAPSSLAFENAPPASFVLTWAGRGKLSVATTADAGTDFFTATAHGLSNGDRVKFRANSGGSVPGGITENTLLYVVNKTTDTFQVALTSGGTPIDLTTAGSSFVHSTVDNFKLFWF